MSECVSCGFDNRPGALFCGSCGEQLGRACGTCGEVVSLELAFCTRCGAALVPGAQELPIPEERKVVTRALRRPRRLHGAARSSSTRRTCAACSPPYHARVRRRSSSASAARWRSSSATRSMALFGAPLAHEDDPERAVRAALAVRDAIGELNAADPTLGLHVRIGVNTGEALIALAARPEEGEGMVAGRRRQHRARGSSRPRRSNGILVGEATYRATRVRRSTTARPGRSQAKGKAEPVAVWEAVGRPDARSASTSPARAARRLVGRARRAPAPARRARRALHASALAQLVTLVGAPGDRQEPPRLRALSAPVDADPAASSTGARAARSPTARASASGRSGRWSRRRPASSRPTRPRPRPRSSGPRSPRS